MAERKTQQQQAADSLMRTMLKGHARKMLELAADSGVEFNAVCDRMISDAGLIREELATLKRAEGGE